MMKEKILDMLSEVCEEEAVKDDLDIDLFEAGLLDSLSFVELLVAIEEKLGVIISPSDVERDEMGTPRKIIELIESRK